MEMTEIKVTRMSDGKLRIETDKVSAPAHDSADKLIDYLVKDAGGKHTRTSKIGDKSHLHQHEQENHATHTHTH